MATLKDVAKMTGVSVTTVSYALNNRPEVNENTRKVVLDAAAKLNYKPNGFAKDLRMSKTETIGLILSNIGGPFFSEIISGIEDITFSNGYNLIVCSSYRGKISTAVKFLYEKRTDGIILMASDIQDDVILRAANSDFPVILLDRELKGDYIWSVTVDNKRGMYEGAEHLIRLGYKKIGYLSGPSISIDNTQRLSGFKEALTDNNLEFYPRWLIQGQFTRSGGYRAIKSLIATKDYPEAIFCANDEMAIGAIEAFSEAKIDVPGQIALVGFDDIELSSYVKPPLTTVRHPRQLHGDIATHMLIQALNKDFDNMKNIKLDTQLIVRESCGFNLKKEV